MIKFSDSKDIDVNKIKNFYCRYATWKVNDNKKDWEKILEKSSCIITAWDEDKLVGMARSLSDGVRWANIIDVLVHPSYRKQSIGSNIIEFLEKKDIEKISNFKKTKEFIKHKAKELNLYGYTY